MSRQRSGAIRFPSEIEARFEADTCVKRANRLVKGLIVSAPLYNLFLIADWLLVPDVFALSIWLHVLVTPWMLLAAWLISRKPRPFVREVLAGSIPLLIVIQIDLCFSFTTASSAAHYQYVVIPTLLYANVSLHRLRFPFARAVTATIVALHVPLVFWAPYISTPVAAIIVIQVTICAYITLVANHSMERDLRRSYLFALRDRLLHAEADAASRRDPLTGLASRLHLDEALTDIWSASEFKIYRFA